MWKHQQLRLDKTGFSKTTKEILQLNIMSEEKIHKIFLAA